MLLIMIKNSNKINENEKYTSPSNVISEQILISDNTNFKTEVKNFLCNLEDKYLIFKSKALEFEKDWESFKKNDKNKNVFIEPEQLSIKSPTTILNAPWGTGKTFFVEQIAKNWNENQIANIRKIFKNFMVIDSWKFTSSQSIEKDISLTIYFALCKFININEEKKKNEFFKKIGKVIFFIFPILITITSSTLENFFPNQNIFEISSNSIKILKEMNLDNSSQKNKKEEINDLLKEINEKIEASIIVFDNVERMGVHAWEVIKTIQRLSIFDKLIFLLPINREQLLFNDNIEYYKKNESAIDKYITLGVCYDLKQDYLGILEKLNFNKEDSILINKILNTQINGYNLSIRLIKNAFLNNKIREAFENNKYTGLKQIKRIWNANIINELIKEDINKLEDDFIELCLFLNSKKHIDYNNINSIFEFISKNQNNEELNFITKDKNFFNEFKEINDFFYRGFNLTECIKSDFLIEKINEFIDILEKLKIYLHDKQSKFNKDLINNQDLIKINENSNIEINKKIEKCENDLNILNKNNINKGISPNESEQIYNFEGLITNHRKSISENEKLINNLKSKNQLLENLIGEINQIINGSLNEFLNQIQNFNKDFLIEWNDLKNDKNKFKLIKILNEIIVNRNNYYDNTNNIFKDEEVINSLIKKVC